ncbi:MAG: hypothetical protein AAF705_15680, partial [Bacteroidota bacterium]
MSTASFFLSNGRRIYRYSIRGQFLFLLISLLFLLLLSCRKEVPPPASFSSSVMDYIHQPNINPTIWPADSLKWQQAYLSATLAFERLLERQEDLNEEEVFYCKNQLVELYLLTRRFEDAGRLLATLELTRQRIEWYPGVNADFLLNKSKYLQIIGEGMEVEPLLEKATKLYSNLYGDHHLRLMEVAIERSVFNEFYSSSYGIIEARRFYLEQSKSYFTKDTILEKYAKKYFLIESRHLFSDRKYEEGIITADRGIHLASQVPEFKDSMFMARCLLAKSIHYRSSKNREDEGVAALMRAGKISRNFKQDIYNQEIQQYLAMYYATKNDRRNFDQTLQKISEEFPNGKLVTPLRLKARWHYFRKNYSAAIRYFHEMIQQLDQGQIQYDRSRLYSEGLFANSTLHQRLTNYDSSNYYLCKSLFLGDPRYQQTAYAWEDLKDLTFINSGSNQFICSGRIAQNYVHLYEQNPQDHSYLEKALHLYLKTDELLFGYSLMANDEAAFNFLSEVVADYYPDAINTAYHL